MFISPIGPSSSSSSGWSRIWRNIGNRNPSVLPLPVLAIPMRSRPDIIAGIAWACIGVGWVKLFLKQMKYVKNNCFSVISLLKHLHSVIVFAFRSHCVCFVTHLLIMNKCLAKQPQCLKDEHIEPVKTLISISSLPGLKSLFQALWTVKYQRFITKNNKDLEKLCR